MISQVPASGSRQFSRGRMVTRQRVGQIILVAATCMATLAADQIRKEFKYNVGPKASISINNEYGPVTVKPSGTNQILVTAILQSNKVEVDQEQNGDRVELQSHLLPGASKDNARVEYQVQVPTDTSVTIHSSDGPVHAEQLRADLAVVGDSAKVDVNGIADAHVHVDTLDGPVTLNNISNGHIEVSSVRGDVIMNSVTGPHVSVTSTSGKIHYDGDFGVGGEYQLTSHTGDIDALVPADASVEVTARSMRGAVENDFPLSPKKHTAFLPQNGRSFIGTAGRAASSVVIRTISGKIRFKKR